MDLFTINTTTMRSLGWFVLVLCFAASSCEKGDTLPQPELLSLKSAELVQQTENFGWSLLLALNEAAAPEENVVLSPLSVAQAMGMALNGASGVIRWKSAGFLG